MSFLESEMAYIRYAIQIAQYIYDCESQTKLKIQAKMKHRTIQNVAILHTMLGKWVEEKIAWWKNLSNFSLHLREVFRIIECKAETRFGDTSDTCAIEEASWNTFGKTSS